MPERETKNTCELVLCILFIYNYYICTYLCSMHIPNAHISVVILLTYIYVKLTPTPTLTLTLTSLSLHSPLSLSHSYKLD
jgi:hypothetical protein